MSENVLDIITFNLHLFFYFLFQFHQAIIKLYNKKIRGKFFQLTK